MGFKEFLLANIKDYNDAQAILDQDKQDFEHYNNMLKADRANHRIKSVIYTLVNNLSKEEKEKFQKENNVSFEVFELNRQQSQSLINDYLDIKNSNEPGKISIIEKLYNKAKGNNPYLASLDEIANSHAKDLLNIEESPKKIDEHILNDKIKTIKEKVNVLYKNNPDKIKEFNSYLDFANENIIHEKFQIANYSNQIDEMSVKYRSRQTLKDIKDTPIEKSIKNSKDSSLYANDNFYLNEEGVKQIENTKIVLSEVYKNYLKDIIPRMLKDGIVTEGEEKFKNYGFKQFSDDKNIVIDNVDDIIKNIDSSTKKDFDNLLNNCKTFKATTNRLDNYFNEVDNVFGKNPYVAGNIDISRNGSYPLRWRQNGFTNSHLSSLSFIAGFVKKHNIDLDDFLNEPTKYIKEARKEEYKEFFPELEKDIINGKKGAGYGLGEWTMLSFDDYSSKHNDIYNEHFTNIGRAFESLVFLDPDDTTRKANLTAYSLHIDLLETERPRLIKDFANGNFFTMIPKKDRDEIITNYLVIQDKKDRTVDNIISPVLPNLLTLKKYDNPFNREKYIKEKFQLKKDFTNNLCKNIFDFDERHYNQAFNTSSVVINAHNLALEILQHKMDLAGTKEYENLLAFAKKPLSMLSNTAESNNKYNKSWDFSNEDFEYLKNAGEKDILKSLNSLSQIGKNSNITKTFKGDNYTKNWQENYKNAVSSEFNKLSENDRTEENLFKLLDDFDTLLSAKFKAKGINADQNQLRANISDEKQIDFLSSLIPSKKLENIDNDTTKNKDEKLMDYAKSLKALEKKHAERKFSIFHIPTYFSEWKAIKNLNAAIISKGYTQEELNTAKGNVDLTNPKIANKINQEQKIEQKIEQKTEQKTEEQVKPDQKKQLDYDKLAMDSDIEAKKDNNEKTIANNEKTTTKKIESKTNTLE